MPQIDFWQTKLQQYLVKSKLHSRCKNLLTDGLESAGEESFTWPLKCERTSLSEQLNDCIYAAAASRDQPLNRVAPSVAGVHKRTPLGRPFGHPKKIRHSLRAISTTRISAQKLWWDFRHYCSIRGMSCLTKQTVCFWIECFLSHWQERFPQDNIAAGRYKVAKGLRFKCWKTIRTRPVFNIHTGANVSDRALQGRHRRGLLAT